jgi:hypothetical protein
MFLDKNKLRLAFSHSVKKEDRLFADIYEYGNIKTLFRMALDKGRQVENDARHNIIYDRSDALL